MFLLFGQRGLTNRKKEIGCSQCFQPPPVSANPSDGNLAGLFMHSAPLQRAPFKHGIFHLTAVAVFKEGYAWV